jgi:pimeloyl-ACP methyl ester carboxylesterase
MLTTTPRSIRATTLLVTLALASCSAPISFQKIACKTPAGQFNVSPLSEALRELEAGKTARDPMVASGHFFESARLAGNLALAGESGALALYNQATGLLVERLDENKTLPWGRTITIGSGNASYTLRGKQEPGAPADDRRYVNVDSLKFDGVYSSIRATRPGVGAPLVAISAKNNDFRKTYETQELHKALTAVLRFDGSKFATLELYDPLEAERISIAGRNPQLAADFSAPVSMLMSVARPDKLGLSRLLNPQKYSDTARLTRLQEYDPKRTPVLFVHGLDSTPATWTLMYHSLMQDPAIRKNYQFWAFSYPSGYPYFYSASLLRKELDGVKRAFPSSKEMIIVGHSMGGMISRLMVTDANDTIWRSMFGTPPAQTHVRGASRQLLEDAVVFDNREEIGTAIFIAAPHRGSELSNNFIGRMFSRLVRMPTFLTDARNAVASVVTADAASLQLDRAPNSIDTLSPDNRFVREVNKLPIAEEVTYHSIMGDRGKGNTPDSSDGVVPYWSSHLNGAASEKIVPSGHSAHENPEGIQEVRHILNSRLKRTR